MPPIKDVNSTSANKMPKKNLTKDSKVSKPTTSDTRIKDTKGKSMKDTNTNQKGALT